MKCTYLDYLYHAGVVAFLISALASTWGLSSLMKILELRHASRFARLGNPRPLQVTDSDSHQVGLISFVCSKEYKGLHDEQLGATVRGLRFLFLIGISSLVCIATSVLVTDVPAFTLSASCLRN